MKTDAIEPSQTTPDFSDGFTVRLMDNDNDADLEALVNLYDETDALYQIGLINGRDLLEAGLRSKAPINSPNPLLVVEHPEAGRRFVGTLSLEPRLESGRNLFFLHGLVHPAWTKRGVGVRLVKEALNLMQDPEAAKVEPLAPALPTQLVFSVTGSMPRAEELVREFGLQPERYYVTLYIDDLTTLEVPSLPSNYSLRPFQVGQDEAAYTDAFNDSYFSNWGYSAATVERVVYGWQRPPSDPAKLLLIWDDTANVITSFARLRIKPETISLHGGRGEIAWIGTRSNYQHQGLGRAILVAALLGLRDTFGFKGAAAVVDVPAVNPQPILKFFKTVGFHEVVERRITICRSDNLTT
jgi:GNAT superfamily N-acetyltransferase